MPRTTRTRCVRALCGLVAAVASSCGPARPVVEGKSTTTVFPAHRGSGTGTSNKEKATAEADRLLGLVVMPSGAVELDNAPPSLRSGPVMGTPATTSLIDESRFWRVPMSMSATLAWLVQQHPGGLSQTGFASSSSGGTTTTGGVSYDAPSSPAWTNASVEIGVAPDGSDSSFVKADGIALWIDPVPLRDTQPGPRLRFSTGSGCPATDRGFVGVSNPPPPLDSSLLPSGTPTGGLACQYYGLNGQPFALKQTTVMGPAAAQAFSTSIGQLQIGHLDGATTSCPMDDGSATVIALSYANGQTVDLWMATTGCAQVSNGYIVASGAVPS